MSETVTTGEVTSDVGGVAGERLRSFVERIERLEEEKKALQDDIKEVMAEAKGRGYDTKAMRTMFTTRWQCCWRACNGNAISSADSLRMWSKQKQAKIPAYSRTRAMGS